VAKTVFLSFALRKLQAAEKTAKDILVSVKKSATLSRKERREQAGQARASLKEIRARQKVERQRLKLGRRAHGLRGRDVVRGQQDRFAAFFGTVGAAREKGELLGRMLLSGEVNVSQLLSGVGPLLAGMGPFAALLAPLTEKLMAYVDERLEQELKVQASALRAELATELFVADFEKRFREDPAFAQEQAQKAFLQTLREEAMHGRRIDPQGSLLTEYGL